MHLTRPSRRMFPHQVDIQLRDTEATSSTGGSRCPSTTTKINVVCLVSEKRGSRAEVGMHEIERRDVRVLFPEDADLTTLNQLVFTTGIGRERIFEVNAYRDDMNLGRLWYADCTEQVSPIS